MPPAWLGPRDSHQEDRVLLVQRLSQELEHRTAPRTQLLIVMLLAGGAAFLTSVLLLWSPADVFEGMAVRYPAAALCGYLAFIALIRVWIALHRPAADSDSGFDPLPDALDVVDAMSSVRLPRESTPAFGGGRSGGGGASGDWSGGRVHSSAGSRGSWGIDLDLDGGFWLVLAGAVAAAGLVAIGYVIYMAPVLLAEVALDAAIISVLYRRLRRDEQGYWLTTVISNTWIPALVLVVFAFAAGFALQQVAPEARSIGGVVQAVAGSTGR
jgi:hypothetical protein